NGQFQLVRNPEVIDKVTQRLAKFEDIAKAATLTEEIAKEGRSYLAKMPRLESQRDMRKKYQQLADGTLKPEEFLKQREEAIQALKLTRSEAEAFATKILKI